MQKLIIAAGLSALLMGTTALAVEPPVENENSAATVINIDGNRACVGEIRVPGRYEDGTRYNKMIRIYGDSLHSVVNKNRINTICSGEIPLEDLEGVELPAKTSDFTCKVFDENGVKIKATGQNLLITPSGNVKLKCYYKFPKG